MVLAGRGGDGDDERRDAVAAYIVEVNMTQQALVLELEAVSNAYRRLDLTAGADPRQLRRLETAEANLRRLRSRLARLDTPAEATRLRSLLLGLVRLEIAFAAEVSGLVRYLPLQARAAAQLAAASRRLNRALDDAVDAAGQQAAFDDYGRALDGILGRLERAVAPVVLQPARKDELARLRRLQATSSAVGRALAGQDAEAIDLGFRAFVRANAPSGTSRAERAAVVAFNRRLETINRRRAAIAAERNRLDLALR